MSPERELLKRFVNSKWNYDDWCLLKADAEELLAQPEQEPVGYIDPASLSGLVASANHQVAVFLSKKGDVCDVGLYTAPQKLKPLSDEWIKDNIGFIHRDVSFTDLVRAVEKAHGIGGEK